MSIHCEKGRSVVAPIAVALAPLTFKRIKAKNDISSQMDRH